METWTSAGPFQVVALLCGHLFCRQCVSKWIGLQKPTSNRTLGAKIEVACPTCKTGSSAALKKVERRKFLPLLGLTRRPLSVRDSDELISLRTDREKHLSQITLLTQQKEKSAYDHQNMLMAYRGLERKQDDLLKEVLGLKGQIHQ